MYLMPVDDVLQHYSPTQKDLDIPRQAAVRWMDDIWLFGGDLGQLRSAQLALQQVMRDLGLNMHIGKTDVLEGPDLVRQARELEHSAVDWGLSREPPNLVSLNELVDKQLERPEFASRTTIRFLAHRMAEHQVFDRVPDLAEQPERMPQGADYLARLFRKAGVWKDLQGWFIDYWQSPWGVIEWSVAQFGTMFPSDGRVGREIRDHLADVLVSGRSSLALVPFAAQRLAAWDPGTARAVFRAAAEKAHHPFERRSLGLAALNANDERGFVRQLLGEYEENSILLELLEDQGWHSLSVTKDYDGRARRSWWGLPSRGR
jgi:hypothetical protein